jgi:polysaccharide export outer membrane protein
MLRYLFYLLIASLLLSSCVPNRKYVYMQKNDIKKKDVPRDSVVREYSIATPDLKIQPQDVLSIRFQSLTTEEFDFLSMAGGTVPLANPQAAIMFGELVSPEGEVNYPVIGKVKVAGLSIFEAQDKLRNLATQFLESPKVIVRVVNFRITVLGEVKHEGQVPLPNNRVSIIEALGIAGGIGELADRSKIKLIRQVNQDITVQYINVLDENLVNSPYYYMRQNDILIVPPLKQRAFRTYFGPNLALVVSTVSVLLLAFNLISK